MLLEDYLYLAANLSLFVALLLAWSALYHPRLVRRRFIKGPLILFLAVQGLALSWSAAVGGYAVLTHPWASTVVAIETAVLLFLLQQGTVGKTSQGVMALTLAFVIHTYGLIQLSPQIPETVVVSPFVNIWYGLHMLTAAATCGAYVCAAGATVDWVARTIFHRFRPPGDANRDPDALPFSRWALMVAYPVLTSSVILRGVWTYLAFGRYWSWHPTGAWLFGLWLLLTITLHAPVFGRRDGAPKAMLVLLGLVLALLILPLLGQGATGAQ